MGSKARSHPARIQTYVYIQSRGHRAIPPPGLPGERPPRGTPGALCPHLSTFLGSVGPWETHPKRGMAGPRHTTAEQVNRRPHRSLCWERLPTYLWGPVRAPAVLVTVEARQQDVLVRVHLAKPQRLLGVVTDHKMAEDQLLHLRALVLKEKGDESQRASD